MQARTFFNDRQTPECPHPGGEQTCMGQASGRATGLLTCDVGAGAVVRPVLHQPVIARQLLGLAVLSPGRLRAVWGPVLSRVVVQLKAFALWSGFT